jgi:hypothetical protein
MIAVDSIAARRMDRVIAYLRQILAARNRFQDFDSADSPDIPNSGILRSSKPREAPAGANAKTALKSGWVNSPRLPFRLSAGASSQNILLAHSLSSAVTFSQCSWPSIQLRFFRYGNELNNVT